MADVDLTTALSKPAEVIAALSTLPCVESMICRRLSSRGVVYRLVLLPYDASGSFIGAGYPIETVNVVIGRDGIIRAIPKSGTGRRWRHRNSIFDIHLDLCLWDPTDPSAIRWVWEDGLEEYVRIVSRHLIYEEFYRRHGRWPVEESPHGSSPTGRWPIRTAEMRRAVTRWRRG